jgi:putative transposase
MCVSRSGCRDVEDLLAERGLDVSYETVRRWVLKFGPLFRPRTSSMPAANVAIASRRDGRDDWGLAVLALARGEGEVLDLLVQRRRDKAAAMKLMRKLLKK